MTDFVFFGLVLVIVAASVLDIVRYSPLFDGVTAWAERNVQSKSRWKYLPAFGWLCSYCLSHWIVAVFLLGSYLLPNSVCGSVTFFDRILLFFITARLATMLHENMLRPIPVFAEKDENPLVEEAEKSTHVEHSPEDDDFAT